MIEYLILTLVVFIVVKKIHHYRLSQKWSCKPAFKVDGGLSYLISLKREHDSGFALERGLERFQKVQKKTITRSIWGRQVIETIAGENIKALISTQFNDYSIGHRHVVFKPLLGNGIFASEGDRWKTSRELLKPQFVRDQISHVTMMETHFKNLAYSIKHQNGFFDLQDLFHKLTFDVATEFLFGESTRTLVSDSNNQGFSKAFNVVQDIITMKMMLGPVHFLYCPKEYKDSLKIIHESVGYYVDKALNVSEKDLNSVKGYVFLYELVKQTTDPKILQDELLSIMLAGRNTTSSLLSFLFFELSRNPQVWTKLKQEIDESFDNDLEKITFESMKRCTYLKYCINETLRMYPPVSRNLRVASKNTTIPRGGGPTEQSPVFVTKGTVVLFNLYDCHRTEHFGEFVDTFNPDRWKDLKPGSNFLPFGTGPRICLGQQFALTEASYFTIRILQTFSNVTSITSEYPPKKVTNATMRLYNGLQVKFDCET
ncbi:cytochrome P450 52A13 [[Candida] jaroonii]|uniref:Cytochrome P450 52A13 n=1 Tax=[Candida] jaroonii TaxID=467808 RepID=A0ACA9YEQ5_9ASCO|nr:cytochrome P450 52A13 [[Candida] jaroonii]